MCWGGNGWPHSRSWRAGPHGTPTPAPPLSPPNPNEQAGGGGELEASLLETPTFVLSVVFFVFLALSFSFELVRRPANAPHRSARPCVPF